MPQSSSLVRTATLKNGLAVTIRPLRDGDRDAVERAVEGLEPESIYTRLFGYRKITPQMIDRIVTVDPRREVVLLATIGSAPDETVIGGCRLVELPAVEGRRSAEVAFTIEEDHQGQGLAGRFLALLIEVARSRGLDELEADVLAQNASMLRVFERAGLPMRHRREGSSIHLSLELGARPG